MENFCGHRSLYSTNKIQELIVFGAAYRDLQAVGKDARSSERNRYWGFLNLGTTK